MNFVADFPGYAGLAALVCYFVLRAAQQLSGKLGSHGFSASARIPGFLIIGSGMKFVINGISELPHA